MGSEMEEYKGQIFDKFASIGRAFSNPKRLELLDLLLQSERRVEELAQATKMPVSSVSQHLQVLKSAHLVESRKEGLYVYYRAAGQAVSVFWQSLQSLTIDRLADARELVNLFVDRRDEFEPVAHSELIQKVKDESVVVVDVRPSVEYQWGHLPHARSIPLSDLEDRLSELPIDREIVAYCRGKYCLFSIEAVSILRKHGFRARRMEGGFSEWRADGNPVESPNDQPNGQTR